MTPQEYQNAAIRTECSQDAAFVRIIENRESVPLLHSVIGMLTELGEMADCLKKWLWYGQEFDRVNFAEELGDALWYQAVACQNMRIEMETVMEKNIAKLRARFPEKFTNHLAEEKNREREIERQILEKEVNGYLSPPEIAQELLSNQSELRSLLNMRLVETPRAIRVGHGITIQEPEQTTPAEHAIEREIPAIATAHFGDGLVREVLDTSYNMFCGRCNKAIHRTNTCGHCPDCAANIRAGR